MHGSKLYYGLVLAALVLSSSDSFSLGAVSSTGSGVTICHTTPGGGGRELTVTIPASAVDRHLAHGDTVGPCLAEDCRGDAHCQIKDPCTVGWCDPDTGECVYEPLDCDDNLFCNGIETCDPATGDCVSSGDPCLYGGECANECDEDFDTCDLPEGTLCTNDGDACTDDFCEAGECVHESRECDAGLMCDPATGDCVECLNDAHCDDGDLCTEDQCDVGRVCANELVECPGNLTCDPVTGECVCFSDADCDGGLVCDLGSGDCVECLEDAHCDDGLFCNGEEVCVGNACVAGTNPCDVVEVCDEEADVCILPQTAKILFTAIELGTSHRDIWMVNPDGSDAVQLTVDGSSINPRVSPDGTQLVFCSERDGHPRPWLSAIDGSDASPLSPELNDMVMGDCGFMTFAWSSTGDRIAIAELIHPNTKLYIVHTDGSILAENILGGRGGSPDWIPDTEFLLINNETTPNWSPTMELWKIAIGQDSDGDGEWDGTRLTFDGNSDNHVNLSPDGTRIAWMGALSGYSDGRVFIADFDGQSLESVTQCTTRYSERPVWSPDGDTVVFTGRYPDADLYAIDVSPDNSCANERLVLHWPGYYLHMDDFALLDLN